MRLECTSVPDVRIIEASAVRDERGWLLVNFDQRRFDDALGREVRFVQENHSLSHRNEMLGLDYQLPPRSQGKLVRVVRGSAFDVAVDVRRGSPTFLRWVGVMLDAIDHRQLWIPPGFAHGFLALEDDTHCLYKLTDHYAPALERSIAWNDSTIGIQWPKVDSAPIVSIRDAAAPMIGAAEVFN